MNQQAQFEDAESYNLNYMKDKITFRDIILQHLRKITMYSSVEFRGGYWDEKSVITGSVTNVLRTYIPDTREVYSGSVECLADMLFPYFDDEMREAEEKAKKALKEAFNDKSVVVEIEREGETKEERTFKSVPDKLSFRTIKRSINRNLFRALCSFLFRKKYLELGSIED